MIYKFKSLIFNFLGLKKPKPKYYCPEQPIHFIPDTNDKSKDIIPDTELFEYIKLKKEDTK